MWRIVSLAVALVVASCGGSSGADAGTEATLATPDTAASETAPPTTTTSTSATAAHDGATSAESSEALPGDGCAHVIDGRVEWRDGTAIVSATVSSADTGWDKYADAWEVRTLAGEVLGVRQLAHPHENEQPFTRTLSGVTIPAGITEVELAARDSVEGWCGAVFTVTVPARS